MNHTLEFSDDNFPSDIDEHEIEELKELSTYQIVGCFNKFFNLDKGHEYFRLYLEINKYTNHDVYTSRVIKKT